MEQKTIKIQIPYENRLLIFSGTPALATEEVPLLQHGQGPQLSGRPAEPLHHAESRPAMLPADERPVAEAHPGKQG